MTLTMQFQTPQFIETENKIIGPLTLKQFFYLAVGFGVSFTFFFILNFWLWFLISLVVGVAALGFAFVKIGAQPLPIMVSRAFLYFLQPRLYLWERKAEKKLYDSGITRIPANSGGVSGSNSFGGNAENKIEEIFRGDADRQKTLAGFDDDQNSDSAARKNFKNTGLANATERKFPVFQKINRRKRRGEKNGLQITNGGKRLFTVKCK